MWKAVQYEESIWSWRFFGGEKRLPRKFILVGNGWDQQTKRMGPLAVNKSFFFFFFSLYTRNDIFDDSTRDVQHDKLNVRSSGRYAKSI